MNYFNTRWITFFLTIRKIDLLERSIKPDFIKIEFFSVGSSEDSQKTRDEVNIDIEIIEFSYVVS